MRGSLFTEIAGFPTGFGDPSTISGGGAVLGTGSPGQPFIFPGGRVSEFGISGINPQVDPTDPTAFPLQFDFNAPPADFRMTATNDQPAVPEPSSAILLASGSALCSWRRGSLTRKPDRR